MTLRLGVSTTGHSLRILRRLRDEGLTDFFELGISDTARAERITAALKDRIATIHALPFMEGEMEGFMFNPCVDPVGAAATANRMAEKALEHGLDYEVYGVHAGLLGVTAAPGVFKVSDRISVGEGLENLRTFKGLLKFDGVILENIYGWDEPSPAIGMTYKELTEMSSIMPLLLDLGHAAVNLEYYRGLSLKALRLEGLEVREVHVSFVDFHGPPPWDHMEYSKTETNDDILSKLAELVGQNPDLPVVLEIKGGLEAIRGHLKLIRRRVGEV